MTELATTTEDKTRPVGGYSGWAVALVGSAAIILMAFLSRNNFLLFHSLVELFSIAVAWSVFILAWNARFYMRDDTLLLLGIAALFSGGLDLVHTLAYGGMGIFPGHTTNLPTELWLGARALQAISLLIAALLPNVMPEGRQVVGKRPEAVIAGYIVVTGILLWAIFTNRMPVAYVEGVGLTPFKRISEYVLSAVFLASGVLIWRIRRRYDPAIGYLILISIAGTVAAELAFTFYIGVYDFSNVAGHLFKIVAFGALYQAVVNTGLRQPYAFLSHQLRQSELRYRQVYESVSLGIIEADPDLRIRAANPATCRILGFEAGELKGMQLTEIIHPEMVAPSARWLDGLLSGEVDRRRSEVQLSGRAGETVHAIVTASAARDAAGSPDRLLVSIADITELKQAEAERERLLAQVQEQALRVRRILDTVPAGVALIAADGRVLLANPLASRALADVGESDAQGALVRLGDIARDTLLAPMRELWQEVAADGRVFEAAVRPITDDPEPDHFVLVLNDVTEARRVRAELAQQARLAAVGQLAAGIAHDFNNILASILLYAEIDAMALDVPDRYRSHAQIIESESRRAAHLIEQILDFGRRAVMAPSPMALVPFVKEQVKLLQRTLPESIRLTMRATDDGLVIRADPGRIQQAITNLATNARDAMPEGGVVTVSIAPAEFGPTRLPPLPEMTPGAWVEIAVSDTGSGMSDEVLDHAFEPFYTTKPPGAGSGLGLAQVYGIARQHDGYVTIDSEVGMGTTVHLFFPKVDAAPVERPSADVGSLPLGDGQRVLVVEDNATVRRAIVSALASLNYTVAEVGNGREALAYLASHSSEQTSGSALAGDVALVLTDLVMPDMGGHALVAALRQQGIPIPVVMMSGHPVHRGAEVLATDAVVGWLLKPVDLEELAVVVAGVVGSA